MKKLMLVVVLISVQNITADQSDVVGPQRPDQMMFGTEIFSPEAGFVGGSGSVLLTPPGAQGIMDIKPGSVKRSSKNTTSSVYPNLVNVHIPDRGRFGRNRVMEAFGVFVKAPEAQKSPVGEDFILWCRWCDSLDLKSEMYTWTYQDWMKYAFPLYKSQFDYTNRLENKREVEGVQDSLLYKNPTLYRAFLNERHVLWQPYYDAIMLCKGVGLFRFDSTLLKSKESPNTKRVFDAYINPYKPTKDVEQALWDKYNALGAFVKIKS